MIDKRGKKIIVAVTGASGSIYAKLLIEKLLEQENIEEIALVYSREGRAVAEFEGAEIATADNDSRIREYANDDMFSPIASGSARYDSMAIIPSSMGTVGRIASGTSNELISRAADVMLKERRQLIVAPRETPLNTIHLRNMTLLSEAGAIILPLSPSFYSLPQNLEELTMTVVERVLLLMGFESESYEWKGA